MKIILITLTILLFLMLVAMGLYSLTLNIAIEREATESRHIIEKLESEKMQLAEHLSQLSDELDNCKNSKTVK